MTWRVITRRGNAISVNSKAAAIKLASQDGDSYIVHPVNKDVIVLQPDIVGEVIKTTLALHNTSAYIAPINK